MRYFLAAALAVTLCASPALHAADAQAPAPKPLITSAGVANAAGYTAERVSPGEIIVIFGEDLGPTDLTTLEVVNGFVTSELAGVQALFDGMPAPLVYVSAGQLSAIVPLRRSNPDQHRAHRQQQRRCVRADFVAGRRQRARRLHAGLLRPEPSRGAQSGRLGQLA